MEVKINNLHQTKVNIRSYINADSRNPIIILLLDLNDLLIIILDY